jgi:hypothetical protein
MSKGMILSFKTSLDEWDGIMMSPLFIQGEAELIWYLVHRGGQLTPTNRRPSVLMPMIGRLRLRIAERVHQYK